MFEGLKNSKTKTLVALLCLADLSGFLIWAWPVLNGTEYVFGISGREPGGASYSFPLNGDQSAGGSPRPEEIFFNSQRETGPVTLFSFGDLMLDRYVRVKIESDKDIYPFGNLVSFLADGDIVLSNLEGSFTDFPPKKLNPNNTIFTFDPALIPALKTNGFNFFNLANNHALDFGGKGFGQSKEYLDKAGLDHFGDPLNEEGLSLLKNIRGWKIGFVGYNELGTNNFDGIIAEIKKMKEKTDAVVVYTHWGLEYHADFSRIQQAKARELIDAGADMVLGSHPHVIQPLEVYKNKIIFYSLGNFLFDQTFSEKTQTGLGVKIVFDKFQTSYFLQPLDISGVKTNLLPKEKSGMILTDLAGKSVASNEIKKQIAAGKITISNDLNR